MCRSPGGSNHSRTRAVAELEAHDLFRTARRHFSTRLVARKRAKSTPMVASAAMTSTRKAAASGALTDLDMRSRLLGRVSRARARVGHERLPTTVRVGGVLLVLACATALHLLRQRGVPVWDSLWAEDGRIFLTGSVHDFLGTFFAQYGGYFHIVARIVAGVAALFPFTDAAAAMATGAAFVIALLAAFVYVASSAVLQSRAARFVLAAVVLLVPVPGPEMLANATNLHFYLLFACFWALFWQSEEPLALAARCAVLLVGTLSDPLAGLLLPLAIVAPAVRRNARSFLVSVVFVSGFAAQVLAMIGGERPQRLWSFSLSDLSDIFSLRVTGGLLVGDRFLGHFWLAYGRAFSYAALLIIVVIVGLLAFGSDRMTVYFVVIALGYAGLFFCVQLVGRGTRGMAPVIGTFQLNGARYVLLPFLFLTAALIALVDRGAVRHRNPRWRWARYATLLWIVCVVGLNYSVFTDRSKGPSWHRELTRARITCTTSGREFARILVAPEPPRVWFATLPCDRIRR
jgi:hypothetical protein